MNKFEFEKNNEYINGALSSLDNTKKMLTYIKNEQYVEFLKHYKINDTDYEVFHSAYFSSNGINDSYYELPYTLLNILLANINIELPVFYNEDKIIASYQGIKLATLNIKSRKYIINNYSLKTISDKLSKVNTLLEDIKHKVYSRRYDKTVAKYLANIPYYFDEIKLPVKEFNAKIEELKAIYNKIGYEEVTEL